MRAVGVTVSIKWWRQSQQHKLEAFYHELLNIANTNVHVYCVLYMRSICVQSLVSFAVDALTQSIPNMSSHMLWLPTGSKLMGAFVLVIYHPRAKKVGYKASGRGI